MQLTWDEVGDRLYETGVDHGVLFLPDGSGNYVDGVAWNGLTTVTESPSGAEATATYADNIKYLNLISAEQFGATVEAYTYPDEFAQFDGLATPTPGVMVGQQVRKIFGLAYRTRIGNDVEADDLGYKLHLVYGAQAAPSEKAYASINDSPEAITFSWAISTTPVAVTGMRPTSIVTIDSTKTGDTELAALETILYGAPGVNPRLPLPDEVIDLIGGGVTVSGVPTAPTYNAATDTMTIPTVTGVSYYVDGEVITPGAHVITEDTVVSARPNSGYVFPPNADDDWTIYHT